MKLRNIELYIDKLVLHVSAPGDHYYIAEAVERGQAQMFAEQHLPSSLTESSEIDYLDGGTFEESQNSGPEAIGTQVAQAVYRGVSDSK